MNEKLAANPSSVARGTYDDGRGRYGRVAEMFSRTISAAATLAAALAAALLLLFASGGVALAHHSWAGYDTSRTFYLAGTVRQVGWGNPHAELLLEVPADLAVPGGLSQAGISEGLEKVGGRQSLERATVPKNAGGTWAVELESPSYMAARGMGGPPRVGEQAWAVGFLSGSDPRHLRVEAFFLDDGRTISVREAAVPTLPSGEAALDEGEERVARGAGPEGDAAMAGPGGAPGGEGFQTTGDAAGAVPGDEVPAGAAADPGASRTSGATDAGSGGGWWVASGGVAALALVAVSPHAAVLFSHGRRSRGRSGNYQEGA